ncbi:MAG TPA: GNAT family N-acetyltransferase [Chloroflexota bacterium]|nr:GNAT family N-acetyltransferase [Chloroflexota bacterium]
MPERGMNLAASGITLRAAQSGDCRRCQEIAVAAWEPIYASSRQRLGEAIFEQLYPAWRAAKAGQIAAAFQHHPQWIVVACAGQEVVGFATFRLDGERRVGEIGNNAVEPAWQGRGIATALYERVLEEFRRQGMLLAKVTTGLDEAHAPARAAYRRVGFSAEAPSVTLYREL